MLIRILAIVCALVSTSWSLNYQALESYILKANEDWKSPGLAIAIVEDGKISYVKVFGFRSTDNKKPITPETVFPIASLTKAFSALLMLKLAEEKKLNLDDPIIKYLPDFKLAADTATHEMTVAKLFQHRSGLRGFAFDTFVEMGWSEQEIYHILDQVTPDNTFDERFDYQNIFPGLFGWISEKITGQPINQTFKEQIFDPIGMSSASLGEFGVTAADGWVKRLWARIKYQFTDHVQQHYSDSQGNPHIIQGGNPAIYKFATSRGINASIQDMAKWLQFWVNGGVTDQGKHLVSPEQLAKMLDKLTHVGAPQGGRLFPKERVKDIYYGMGWYNHDYAGLKQVISHMGGMTGVRSLISYVPEKKVGIVILSNLGGMRVNLLPEAIRARFLDLVAGIEEDHDWSAELKADLYGSREKSLESRRAQRLKNPVPARSLERYIGVYENKLYGPVEIAREGEHLVIKYRNLKAPLTHWNGDNFTFKANQFTPSYSETDYSDMVFGGSPKDQDTTVCVISLFYEGPNTYFNRTKDTN